MNWTRVGSEEKITPGVVYRSRYTIGVPYSMVYGVAIAGLRAAARPALAVAGIELLNIVPVVGMDTTKPWEIQATWKRKG